MTEHASQSTLQCQNEFSNESILKKLFLRTKHPKLIEKDAFSNISGLM